MQIYAAYGLQYPAALNGPQFLGAGIASKGVVVDGGTAYVPDGPGLGVEIDEAKLRELAVDLGVDTPPG